MEPAIADPSLLTDTATSDTTGSVGTVVTSGSVLVEYGEIGVLANVHSSEMLVGVLYVAMKLGGSWVAKYNKRQ